MRSKELFPITVDAVVLDCPDVNALADFYIHLLGWERTYEEPDEWVDISCPENGMKIAFQRNEHFVPPVWPEKPGQQQQMAHIDFRVQTARELDLAVQHALACGAVLAPAQFGEGKYISLIDPVGHPFCFVVT